MKGTENLILSNVLRYPIIQMINPDKDVIVTIRKKNGLVFVTNNMKNDLPISCYMNLDDIQSKLKAEELVVVCKKAIREGGWKFRFWNSNL